MLTPARILLVSAAALSLVICAAYFAANQSMGGYLDYLAWKAFSGDAGEGAYAQIGESSIYYEIHGSGEPLLLLHGGFASIDSYYKQIPLLARHYRVIAVDSRGHGRSTDTAEPLSYASMSDDVSELMDQLQVVSTRILGWSDGGVVGLDLAMRDPGLVSRLVIFGSNFHYDGLIPDELSNGDYPADGELLDFARSSYQTISPHPDKWPEFVTKSLAMWNTQPAYTVEQLGQITAATLVMAGDDDMIKLFHTEALADAIDNATLEIIPDSTHFAPIENPEAVNRNILRFLANQAQGARKPGDLDRGGKSSSARPAKRGSALLPGPDDEVLQVGPLRHLHCCGCGRELRDVVGRQRQLMLLRLIGGADRVIDVGRARHLDMRAHHMTNRLVRHPGRQSRRAGAVLRPVGDVQPPRIERVPRDHEARPRIVERQVIIGVPRNRQQFHSASAQLEPCWRVRPVLEAEEGCHRSFAYAHHLDVWRRSKRGVALAVIAMTM